MLGLSEDSVHVSGPELSGGTLGDTPQGLPEAMGNQGSGPLTPLEGIARIKNE